MIIWGGKPYFSGGLSLKTGGRYRPAANSWTPVNTNGAPAGRADHTAVWTGSEMIVWGGEVDAEDPGNTVGRYSPVGNNWSAMGHAGHTAVWTGSEMIIWGGYNGGYLNVGGRSKQAGNSWTPLNPVGAPGPRYGHTAVWTGSEMIVWGGYNGGTGAFTLNDGGRYLPAANSWTPVSTTGAPGGRADHTAVWTGSEMIVWGGTPDFSGGLNDGRRYHPAGDRWTSVNTAGAPTARRSHTALWTGSEMIVWGGGVFPNSSNEGGRYHPDGNLWTPVSTAGAPDARFHHTAVWTGSEMIVWGGTPDFFRGLNTGGRYHPAGDSWKAVTTVGAPAARTGHTAMWTGSKMIVWGGWDGSSYFNDTFSYTPDCGIFEITSVVLSGGNLTLSFPTATGRTYTLWRSDTLADGT